MPIYTFAYRFLGREHHRSEFDSDLTAQRFGEEIFRIGTTNPTDEIRIWEGRDTERTPDATVRREG